MKMVNSAWKGQIGIPDVRNYRFCHCLSRVARTTGSERRGVENRFVRCVDVLVHESMHPADLF